MEKKILMIVDPQVDFITGSLPVPKAAEAMDSLADYVAEKGTEYAVRIVTSDWHPYRHCSFQRNGGQWPAHCVQNSAGAAIWQKLLEALEEVPGGYTLLYKGDSIDKEEYSIMDNARSAEVIKKLVAALGIKQIDVCGLAGDICVKNTAEGLKETFGEEMVKILEEYSPRLE